MADEKTTKHSGYVYNSRTKQGFQRMRREGIVLPPFRIEDNVTKLLTNHYDRLLAKLALASKGAVALERAVNDSVYSEIVGQLQNSLLQAIRADKTKLSIQISKQLTLAQEHFFESFIEDASEKVSIRVQFALNKDEVFQQRIEGLHKHYLDSALKRIGYEEDFLKSSFLMELTDYAMGKSTDIENIKTVIESMKKNSVKEARFFARDQFSKFNKSLTISSLETAGASHVEWLTVGDQRVRPTHRVLNHKVFPIDQIPEEQHDYNCRCGLVPVFKE
jgi:SPP1 gp7 family putative phage head morphogenesis protein